MLISASFFMLLRNFDLNLVEKLIFSAILGIGLFSTYTYWLSLIFGSIRIGMLLSLVIILGITVFFHFYLTNNQRKQIYILGIFGFVTILLWLLAYLFVIKNMPVPSYVQQFYDCVKNGTDILTCSQRY